MILDSEGRPIPKSFTVAPRRVGQFTDLVTDASDVYAVGIGHSRRKGTGTRRSILAVSKYEVRDSYNPPPLVQIPGEIWEGGCGDSRVPLVDRTNSWSAGGGVGYHFVDVLVCAGASRANPDDGRFIIVRSSFPENSHFVDGGGRPKLKGSGAVRITKAPLGKKGSAHAIDAHIHFKSSLGTVGYLDLADDVVHVTRGPQLCPPGLTGTPPRCAPDGIDPKSSPRGAS